jgi:hypothetical protein
VKSEYWLLRGRPSVRPSVLRKQLGPHWRRILMKFDFRLFKKRRKHSSLRKADDDYNNNNNNNNNNYGYFT